MVEERAEYWVTSLMRCRKTVRQIIPKNRARRISQATFRARFLAALGTTPFKGQSPQTERGLSARSRQSRRGVRRLVASAPAERRAAVREPAPRIGIPRVCGCRHKRAY